MSKEYPNFPYTSMQYDRKGKLKSAIYFVSKDLQYMYGPDKEFQGIWYKENMYDKNGNVQYYEQNAKKILLTGDADGCLIMDDENNARRFGHCANLFKDEKSSVLLQYDQKGYLKEAVFEGKDKKAYTFTYDVTGDDMTYNTDLITDVDREHYFADYLALINNEDPFGDDKD